MIVRKANKTDLDKNLLKLCLEGFYIHYNKRPEIFKESSEEITREKLTAVIDNIVVLEENDSVIGYVQYEINERKKDVIFICELIIEEQMRHKGFAKILMEEVKKIGIENNCRRIELNCWAFNQNAKDMYKHLGFEEQRTIFEKNIND